MFLDNISHTHTYTKTCFIYLPVSLPIPNISEWQYCPKTCTRGHAELGFKEVGNTDRKRNRDSFPNRDSFLHVFRQVKQKEFHFIFLQLWL